MSFYYETKNSRGEWSPVKVADKPEVTTKNGREYIKRVEGVGPEIRAVREIPHYHEHLTLGQLYETLSPDGRFRNV